MVPAGEKKFRTAGDGTEPADNELIAVDGIMVKHIVLFEIAWIVREIVVYSVIADLDIRSGDNILQIHRLLIVRAGVDMIHGNSLKASIAFQRNDMAETVI